MIPNQNISIARELILDDFNQSVQLQEQLNLRMPSKYDRSAEEILNERKADNTPVMNAPAFIP